MDKEKTPSCLQLSYDSHVELDLPLTDQPSPCWSVLRIGWRDAVTSCFCWEVSYKKQTKKNYIYALEVRKVTLLKVSWGLKCIPALQEPSATIHYPIIPFSPEPVSVLVNLYLFLSPLCLNRGILWTLCCAALPCPGLSNSYSPLFLWLSFVDQELMKVLTDLSAFYKFVLF